jgi:hypothetical protein
MSRWFRIERHRLTSGTLENLKNVRWAEVVFLPYAYDIKEVGPRPTRVLGLSRQDVFNWCLVRRNLKQTSALEVVKTRRFDSD